MLDFDHGHAERLADAALREPNRHHAIRFLAGALDGDPEQLPGLRNKGLLATHELERGVPQRADWAEAVERSQPLLGRRNHDLVRGLGYEIVQQGEHSILETADGGAKRAVAVFLQASEQPDEPSARHGGQTPVTYALAQAEREGLTWVLAVRGGSIRLYSTTTAGAAGQRGRAETYVELALPLLQSVRAGYLDLLFSSRALAPGGTIEEIQRASADYTARLSERLRDRVYNQVVPRLAVAVAGQRGGTSEDDLDRHYRTSLTILFRLLFIAYAEDSRLLPLHVNGDYTRTALKSIARDIADRINAGGDLGFDNPLTPEVEPATDAAHTDLWDRSQELFTAVDKGHNRWGIPPYDGGLFSTDGDINPVGPMIADLELSNGDFGPALAALLVDRTPDGDVGPIDFRSLSVREFGTIYEGLLESELSVAEQPLTLDPDGTYLPADEDDAVVDAGDVYLHNQSGVRKATGSYFTKPFAVEHLLDHAVEPTLAVHLDRVRDALDADRPADAANLIFDFRVADIAMGSGHFLTAVVDRLEARYTEFLTQHPIPPISAELDKLRAAAEKALGDLAEAVEIENSSLLRRLIARRCVYGVDMNPISVELARVAMWIHTFVPGLPLSFLDHNLVAGDSLTGIARLGEAADLIQPETRGGGQLSNLRLLMDKQLEAAREPLRRLANLNDATPSDVSRAREAHREAMRALHDARLLFDIAASTRTGNDLPELVDPTQANQYEARAQVEHIAAARGWLHFPVAFPEVFIRDLAGFDVILGNPPWDKVRHEPQQYWVVRAPGLNAVPQTRRDEEIEELRKRRPVDAVIESRVRQDRGQLQTLFKNGYELQGRYGHLDYAQLFLERAIGLSRNDRSSIGYVLPRQFLVLAGWAELREALAQRGRMHVAQGRNTREWIFEDVHQSYMVTFLAASTGGEQVIVQPAANSPQDLRTAAALIFDHDDLRSLTDAIAVPWFESEAEVQVFDQMRQHARISDSRGWVTAVHDARWDFRGSGPHRDLTVKYPAEGWPVLKTRHVRRYAIDDSQKFTHTVADPSTLGASGDPPTYGWDVPRVVFRHPSRNDDTRTLIATLLPSGFAYNKGYVHAADVDEPNPETSLALLGYLNTFVADWWARRLVDRHVTAAVLNNLRIPDWDASQVKSAAALASSLLLTTDVKHLEKEHDILERLAASVTSDNPRAELNALALSGFGLPRTAAGVMLEDFSSSGVPSDVREAIMTPADMTQR